MTTLTTSKFEENKSVREHTLKLVEIAAKLKDLEVPVDDALSCTWHSIPYYQALIN